MNKKLLRGLTVIVCLAGLICAKSASAQNKSINFNAFKYIDIPNGGASSALNFTSGNFTLEAWINASMFFGNNVNTIMGNDSTWLGITTYAGYALRTNQGKLSFLYSYGTGTREIITPSAVFDTAMWQHVAVTKQGGDITLYVNGLVVASASYTTNTNVQSSTKTMKIGVNGSRNTGDFLGDIDEVKVWNVARTQTQVRADMEELCGTIPSSLIAYYKMDDVGSSATSNPIVCASNTALNGVHNGPIPSRPGTVFFNGGLTTLYVDSSNTAATACGARDGSTWAKAFTDLNTAIEIAQTHPLIDKILVAKGTYYPTNFSYDIKSYGKGCQIKSNSNKNKTFHLKPGIDLYGGYPSGGAATASPTIYRTILDGSRAGGVLTDTASTVVSMYNPYNSPDTGKLIGVTVRHAVDGSGVWVYGSYGGAAVIQNCVITKNKSINGAAGISVGITSALIQNDTIIDNINGGVSSGESYLRLYNNYIYGNTGVGVFAEKLNIDVRNNVIAYSTSEGLFHSGGSATIVKNSIHHNGQRGINLDMNYASLVDSNTISNHATIWLGGGIRIYGFGPHQITNNVITNNTAGYGGGIYSFNASNTISGNTVADNHATTQGGGMWLQGGGTNSVLNNIVRQNSSDNNGGGILMDNGMGGINATVANNFIVGNTAQTHGGGLDVAAQKFTVVNNVIANNVAASNAGAQLYTSQDSVSTLINNTFYGNTATDPNLSPNTGGLWLSNKQIKAYHNIFWQNKIGTSTTTTGADYIGGALGKNLFINNAMQLSATNYTTGTGGNSDIGTYASGNFFAVNPTFANETSPGGVDGILGTADDGLQLLYNSFFVGKGKNSLFPFSLTNLDIKKHARVNGDSVDLGAYELYCLPANVSLQSQLNVCKGGATTLVVNSSAAASNVFWYADSTSTSSLSTGQWFYASALNATDTFWAAVNGCESGKRVPVIVTVHDVSSNTNNITACDSFFWTHTNKFYTASGTYSKKYTSVWGCDSTEVLDLNINHSFIPAPQTILACDSFLWAATNTFYKQNGTYSHTLTTATGCDSILTINLTVSSFRASVVTSGKSTLKEIKAKADSYQWLKCDPYQVIQGATDSSYTCPTSGRYAVIATKNGCSDTSNCISVIGTDIENTDAATPVVVKPNPTSGTATVTLPAAFGQGTLYITNALGQTVMETQLTPGNTVNVDLSKYATGLYHISIWADGKYYATKLQKE